jgi:transposase
MHTEKLDRFFGIPSHRVRSAHFLDADGHETTEDASVDTVVVELERAERNFACRCGRRFETYYDCREQLVRDLAWGPWRKVELLVPRFRLHCPECGVRTEPLDWLVPDCGYTRRLADGVALACREVRAISAVAEQFALSWDIVSRIDRASLERELNPPDFSGLRYLAMDEIAIRRGHRYATVFLDCERNRVVWVCENRDRASVRAVFRDVFGPDVCAGIEAVAMDWWQPFEEAVTEYAPNADIVWDFFHIVKSYNKKVIDAVRLEEARRCRDEDGDRQAYTAIKRSKWVLLRNPANCREPARLGELLHANRRLFSVHAMRELLRAAWEAPTRQDAIETMRGWIGRALKSRIPQLRRFAQALAGKVAGIANHAMHHISTGVLEGINNKIKVIKRVAYGFRDMPYFFLKIRANFSAVPH